MVFKYFASLCFGMKVASEQEGLTLSLLGLLLSKTQERKDFGKPSPPCHVGIYWIALAEKTEMSNHVPRLQSFLRILHHFVLAKLATVSITDKGHKDSVFQ